MNLKRLILVHALVFAAPAFAATCESLATLKLADTTITSAQQVAGAFIPPGATTPPPSAKACPRFAG